MSISTSSPYPHDPYQQVTYQQASLNFRAFMEDAELDRFLEPMPVKQNYIKMDEVEKLADALMDKEKNKKFYDIINDSYASGGNPPVIHEEVYNKPISGNLINFNDPALKKLLGMLPIKGIEKKIVGDIERKNLKGDLGPTIKSSNLGDAEGFITNIEPREYNFVAEDGLISSLYFGFPPSPTSLWNESEFTNNKISLMTKIYKLLRIAYDGLLIGTTDAGIKEWKKIGSSDYIQYRKTLTAQRAIADALRAQIQLIISKNKSNLQEAFKLAASIVRRSFPYNEEHIIVARFINIAMKNFTDSQIADKLSKIFTEEFNRQTPAIVHQHIDVQDIHKLIYMFKKYIEALKA